MTENEKIYIEEEEVSKEQKNWSEEFAVAGNELVGTVKKLAREASVRRLVIKNEDRNIHYEVPLLIGVAGIVILPTALTIVGLIAALVTDCKIMVERVEKSPEMETAVA